MDQARNYLTLALNAALLVCFAMLLWQLLIHKQWQMALLSRVRPQINVEFKRPPW
jgi:hypothetical protein